MNGALPEMPLTEAQCRAHWVALHGVALAAGCSPADANDAVQELFLRLIQSGLYNTLGNFVEAQQRVYLYQRLKWHLKDRWRQSTTLRRGHGLEHVQLDDAHDLITDETPATQLDGVLILQVLRGFGFSEEMATGNRTGAKRQAFSRRSQKYRAAISALLN